MPPSVSSGSINRHSLEIDASEILSGKSNRDSSASTETVKVAKTAAMASTFAENSLSNDTITSTEESTQIASGTNPLWASTNAGHSLRPSQDESTKKSDLTETETITAVTEPQVEPENAKLGNIKQGGTVIQSTLSEIPRTTTEKNGSNWLGKWGVGSSFSMKNINMTGIFGKSEGTSETNAQEKSPAQRRLENEEAADNAINWRKPIDKLNKLLSNISSFITEFKKVAARDKQGLPRLDSNSLGSPNYSTNPMKVAQAIYYTSKSIANKVRAVLEYVEGLATRHPFFAFPAGLALLIAGGVGLAHGDFTGASAVGVAAGGTMVLHSSRGIYRHFKGLPLSDPKVTLSPEEKQLEHQKELNKAIATQLDLHQVQRQGARLERELRREQSPENPLTQHHSNRSRSGTYTSQNSIGKPKTRDNSYVNLPTTPLTDPRSLRPINTMGGSMSSLTGLRRPSINDPITPSYQDVETHTEGDDGYFQYNGNTRISTPYVQEKPELSFIVDKSRMVPTQPTSPSINRKETSKRNVYFGETQDQPMNDSLFAPKHQERTSHINQQMQRPTRTVSENSKKHAQRTKENNELTTLKETLFNGRMPQNNPTDEFPDISSTVALHLV